LAEPEDKQRIKLIALDMDGTVLNGSSKADEATLRAIRAAVKMGIRVVPCSGRHVCEVPEPVTSIDGVDEIITANGARVVHLGTQETLYENPIGPEDVARVLDILEQYDLMTEVYMEEGIRVESRCLMMLGHYNVPDRFHAFFRATRQPLPTHDCFLDYMIGRRVQKFNIFFRHPQEKKRLKKQLERETDLKIVLSSENNLEINSPTANKGDGLCHLCEALDIPSSQVMAVGDSDNDLDMLNYAGLAVAMGNGNRHVKAAADWVTSDNDDLGVARALAKYIL